MRQDKIIVTIHVYSKGTNVVKNVKIDDDTHRLLSIEAAKRGAQKGLLCAALINAALSEIEEKSITKHLIIVTNHDNSEG